jgi:hypothetical protein
LVGVEELGQVSFEEWVQFPKLELGFVVPTAVELAGVELLGQVLE